MAVNCTAHAHAAGMSAFELGILLIGWGEHLAEEFKSRFKRYSAVLRTTQLTMHMALFRIQRITVGGTRRGCSAQQGRAKA